MNVQINRTRTGEIEVILGTPMKTLSNYANHIAGTPLDQAFQPATWHKAVA